MPTRTLRTVSAKAGISRSLWLFNNQASANIDRARQLLAQTTYWVHDPSSGTFAPSKFVGFAGMTWATYERASDGVIFGRSFDGGRTHLAIEAALGRSFTEDTTLGGFSAVGSRARRARRLKHAEHVYRNHTCTCP